MPKRQRTGNEVIGVARPFAEEMDVKGQDEVGDKIGVTEPAASPEYGSEIGEELRKVREAVYPVGLFHNVDFRVLLEKQELMPG